MIIVSSFLFLICRFLFQLSFLKKFFFFFVNIVVIQINYITNNEMFRSINMLQFYHLISKHKEKYIHRLCCTKFTAIFDGTKEEGPSVLFCFSHNNLSFASSVASIFLIFALNICYLSVKVRCST